MDLVQEGRFRADLYYRLLVVPVEAPSRRERRDDIPLLAAHFVRRLSRQFGRRVERISEAMMNELISYDWPGNIRELENFRPAPSCSARATRWTCHWPRKQPRRAPHHSLSLEATEKAHIERVLASTGWLVEGPQGAAAILQLNPSTLRSRMRRLGIRRPS